MKYITCRVFENRCESCDKFISKTLVDIAYIKRVERAEQKTHFCKFCSNVLDINVVKYMKKVEN